MLNLLLSFFRFLYQKRTSVSCTQIPRYFLEFFLPIHQFVAGYTKASFFGGKFGVQKKGGPNFARWWFHSKIFLFFTPNLGEMIQFDYFSNGLKPPTSFSFSPFTCTWRNDEIFFRVQSINLWLDILSRFFWGKFFVRKKGGSKLC